jgi:RecB family exonuclease
MPEQKIEATIDTSIRLTGKLDVLHKSENILTFDDYKTGKSVSYLDSESKTAGIKAWRNRFQIIFYYVLIKNSALYKNYSVDKARLIYVESESYKEMVKEYSPKDDEIKIVEKLIPIIWRHVQDLNFPDTSHYEASYGGIKQFISDLLDGKI